MKITILDGFTMNPGDLNYEELASLGELKVYDRTPAELVYERAKDSEIVLTNKTVLDGSMLRLLSNLKYVGVLATGYNVVDVEVAKRLGIIVTNIPAYSTMSVAQNVFALILALTNHAEHYGKEFHLGIWSECKDFSYSNTRLIELAGKKLGIVGYGNIGKAVAGIGRAFGMEVYVNSRKSSGELRDVAQLSVDEIFQKCDVISLHCALTPDTFHIANAERIGRMKKDAILINTGRGPLVDEDALAVALKEHKILGAGLDVLSQEPPSKENPLIGAPGCVVTPHVSWATEEARRRLLNMAVANVRAYLDGHPCNVGS
ncbi:MAG: D-2-hydroxyacid dehydrogenase, partial [Muribaculaceae bacterium]|nr:D-2-hydroxyacid dehydrogenase [Muribaculaceae bacterium]